MLLSLQISVDTWLNEATLANVALAIACYLALRTATIYFCFCNMLQHCVICCWYSVTGGYANTLWQGSVFVSPTTRHTTPRQEDALAFLPSASLPTR